MACVFAKTEATIKERRACCGEIVSGERSGESERRSEVDAEIWRRYLHHREREGAGGDGALTHHLGAKCVGGKGVITGKPARCFDG
jgi:hypothetical protein